MASGIMNALLHGRHEAASGAKFAKDSTRPTDPPVAKDSRIAIVGAGPAGLTMAYLLQKRGYSKVCPANIDARS